MPFNPGVQDISGQLLGQGISQFGQGLAQGIQQYGARKKEEEDILKMSKGRADALEGLAKGFEALGVVPEGMFNGIRQARENLSPKAFIAFADQTSQQLGHTLQVGLQMKELQAKQQQEAAKQQLIAQQQEAARVAAQGSVNPDGSIDPAKAQQIFVQNGGRDNNVLAGAVKMFTSAGPGSPTAAVRDANTIIGDEIKSGKLADDPVAISARRAALVARGGRDEPKRFFNAGVFVDRETGDNPIKAVQEQSSGRVGTTDEKGDFKPLDLSRLKPTTASDANAYLQEADMKKLADAVVDQENGIKALNRFAKAAGGLPQGVDKIATRISAAIKTSVTKEPLSDEELQMGLSKARQERLLGALRTTVLGPGVLTENDAVRIINAVGGDINSVLTNPQLVQETVQELLGEKMNAYKQNLRIYNRHVVGRYAQAGYDQRAAVEPFKPEAPAPKKEGGANTKVINGVTYEQSDDGWVRK